MSSISLKIFREDGSIGSNFSIVDSLATLLKEQQTIETLEKHCGGLMDLSMSTDAKECKRDTYSAKNSLTIDGQLFHQITNSPRSLRVKPGSRLVEEKEEFRLCSKFNTDGKTFSLFDIEA